MDRPGRPPTRRAVELAGVDELIDRGQAALEAGRFEEAVDLLRAASRRAPLRTDVRDLLAAAIECSVEAGGRRAGPRPIPRINPTPLFPTAEAEPTAPPPIAPVALEPPPGPTSPAPPRRRAPVKSRYQERHRRGPLSAFFWGGLVALTLVALFGGAAVWLYLEQGADAAARPQATTTAAAEEVERLIVEKARAYAERNEFTLEIEQLGLLTEGPTKRRLLAEAHARHGDFYTRNKRYNEARDAYEHAVHHDPDNPRYAFDLGWTYYTLARRPQTHADPADVRLNLDQAERHFRGALEVDPARLGALEGLALVEIARGNSPAAYQYLSRIIELAPDSREAKSALSRIEQMGLRAQTAPAPVEPSS